MGEQTILPAAAAKQSCTRGVGTSHECSQLEGRHLSAWEAEWPAGWLAFAGLVIGVVPWLQGLCCPWLAQ